jgi:hypothetical protein
MSNVQTPKGLVGALAAAAETEAPKPADKVYEGYAYLVSLRSGLRFRRLAREEPEKLWRAWAQARKQDELLVWADDAATEARQVADIEIDTDDAESPDPDAAVTEERLREPRD